MHEPSNPPVASAPPVPPTPAQPPTTDSPSERRALGVFAMLAAALVAWIAMPVGIGLLLGALGAFALQPVYRYMRARSPVRPDFAAAACVLFATATMAGAIALLGYLLVVRGVAMAQALLTALGPAGAVRNMGRGLAHRLGPFHVHLEDLASRLQNVVADVASRAATLAAAVASATAGMLLTLFFVTLTMHFTLRNWDALVRRVEILLPLHPRHTRALLEEFRRVGSSVLLGTIVTGVAQGGLAALGYAVAGVPQAAFFGALTAVASLVPVVGTLLVWVPAGLYLVAVGRAGAGVAELAYGALAVVGLSDYVIRPRLVGGHEAPALVTFIALLGGVEVFGLVGLILGPVLVSLALALIRIYEREVAPGQHDRAGR